MEMFDENHQYISLANKYRPQKFEDMVGQESISKTLQNALKLGRIGHAYLFYGPRGCGKTTTARILAKALNCTGHAEDKPTAEPCGECPQCREIAQSADLDVLELDAASNTQVEKVREAIIDTVALASSRDRYKVFILDEVHMLSASSFNALLKTIEEPPAHVVFILATTEKHKVPATIVSRCQTFRFRPITVDEISTHLLDLAEAESIDLTPGAAKIIAKNAGGAMRDALTLMDRAIAYSGNRIDEKLVGEMLGLTPDELIKKTVTALVQKDNAALHQAFETLKNEGFDANSFLKDLKNALGDLFYFTLGQGGEPFDGAKQITEQVSPGFLAQLSRKVNKITEEVKFSDNALISAEVGLFTVMDSCLDLDNFIRRLEALEKGLPAGTMPTQTAAPAHRAPVPAARPMPKPAVAPRVSPADVVRPAPRPAPVIKPSPRPVVDDIIADDEVAEEAAPVSSGTLTDRQIWDKMLLQFKKSPFVYDVMLNSMVQFGKDEWTLCFPPGKEFYQIPAQNKLGDLETAAKKISGRTIKFKISSGTPQNDKPSSAAQTKQTPASGGNKSASISDEEPFVKRDFSADIAATAGTAPADAPEELKDILEIIPGELLA